MTNYESIKQMSKKELAGCGGDRGMIHNSTLPQYNNDIVFSWDFSDKDSPCVCVTEVHRNEKGSMLEATVFGHSFEKAGTISLLQLLEQHRALKQEEEKQEEEKQAAERRALFRRWAERHEDKTNGSVSLIDGHIDEEAPVND